MARSRYQVLVIPYFLNHGEPVYGVFRRRDMGLWQFISGGGEDTDASIEASARRETMEETGLSGDFLRLDTCCSIPANCFRDSEELWGRDCFVVPEYAFALRVDQKNITLSEEHTEYRWADYETVRGLLQYDSNRTALWELDRRLKLGMAESRILGRTSS